MVLASKKSRGAKRERDSWEIPTQGCYSSVNRKQVPNESATPERRESDSGINCKEVPSESAKCEEVSNGSGGPG
eukprot:9160562-Pyramimonas_sp.AAC.1